jgi:hypothetical protein
MRHNPWNLTTLRSVVVLAGATTFAASLTQIAVVVDGSDRSIERLPLYGLELLILGEFSVFDNGLNLLMWPLVVAVWVLACCKRSVATAIAVLVGGALMWEYQDPSEAFNIAWLANPIIAVTWILHLRDVRFAALISAVTALGLTLCFLWVKGLTGPGPAGVNVADFEMRPIISYGIGYWLWVASAAVLAAGVTASNIASDISPRALPILIRLRHCYVRDQCLLTGELRTRCTLCEPVAS